MVAAGLMAGLGAAGGLLKSARTGGLNFVNEAKSNEGTLKRLAAFVMLFFSLCVHIEYMSCTLCVFKEE